MKYTIYDIAKMAKTSPSTISRYINNKPVKEDNKKRIEEVLKNIDFTPNAVARALVSQTLKTIAIITIDIREPIFAATCYNLEQQFSKKGYHVIICNISNNLDKAIEYLKQFLNIKIDGICLIGSIFTKLNDNQEALNLLKNIPIVVANGKLNLANARGLLIDDQKGIRLAVKHLFNKGQKNILFFKTKDSLSSINKLNGFINETKRLNIFDNSNIFDVIDNDKEIYKILDKRLVNRTFDGIIVDEDAVAISIVNYLTTKNIKVGQEVKIIGYNNTLYSEMCLPKLTIVDNDTYKQGIIISKMLEDLINKKEVADYILIPRLWIKQSA